MVDMRSNAIYKFDGEYRWLSNFWMVPLTFGDWTFASAEHAYQAAKSNDPTDWHRIQVTQYPGAAKRLGKYLPLRPDWEEVKLSVMREILEVKFAVPSLRERLLATGDTILIEGNTWGDTFWGCCNNHGHNHLGRLLMDLRAELRLTA